MKRGSSKTLPLAGAGAMLVAVALTRFFVGGNRGALPVAAGIVGAILLAQSVYFWWKYRA